MLSFFLFAQLAAGHLQSDSTYSTPALRAMVAAAAQSNRRVPDSLASYTSRIETETSLLIRDTLGRENTAEVEQLATAAHWDRGGQYDLHIVGYRSQSVGVPYSTLTMVRGWTVPSLYGERLSLGAYFNRRSARNRDSIVAVHPFAQDRDAYYRFSGGDTVATLHAGARVIPIVRIHVHPHFRSATPLSAFDGEIDIDGDRMQIVRMRGQLMTIGAKPPLAARMAAATLGMTAAAYIEFVNAEVDGKYWLPAFQRTEFQAELAMFGETRPVFRIVSTISGIALTERAATGDTLERSRVSITWASNDSVDRFNDWKTSIGSRTASVHSDDFDDLAPDRWRKTGAPRVDLFPRTVGRVARFNRVEGVFLGFSPSIDFRSAAPGLEMGAYGGWAFTEKTARGGGYVTYQRGLNRYGVRAERALASTNDFVLPMSDDPGIGALLASIDDNDYLDRSTAMAAYTRTLGAVDFGLLTLQAGMGRDRSEIARLSHGPIGTGHFRINRGIDEGDYALASADLELHPNVTGDFVAPGFGARLHQEIGHGDLDWQRSELSLSARSYFGLFTFAAHADGGIVTGDVPAQQLFELGGDLTLPGYAYKEFAGDRAALFRGYVSRRFDKLKRPIRIRNFFLPAINPGLGASIEGGWTELSSAAARRAVTTLGLTPDGALRSSATNGVRATAGAGLTLFSDLLHLGVARPIDHSARWRFSVGAGVAF
ncbi:MAG TPA: hypothetical protein VGM82_06480 [Gemmatimonadaceae bacterium]|jgi:hypothetical protein